jgi:predicted Rossmann-fold nucleotide-binding protein
MIPSMSSVGVPFNPLREELYTPDELFDEFDESDPSSYSRCADIAILSYFWKFGANPTRRGGAATLEALHDNAISTALRSFTTEYPNVVAIMGGHGMKRTDPAYADTAHMAFQLAQKDFLLTSGGGPGAMEATHLGAFFSRSTLQDLDAAIAELKPADLPKDAAQLVGANGIINPVIAKELHKWLAPAIRIRKRMLAQDRAGNSLGVPTWLYGFEPTTPFASHCGKYFQNSIREDGLVTIGVRGIVFTPGSAGTVQEIFQNAAQNYYNNFYPMVFLSTVDDKGNSYWEDAVPVRPLIKALLGAKKDFDKVLFTTSKDAVVAFLEAQKL